MSKQSLLVCPFCGVVQEVSRGEKETQNCEECSALVSRGNVFLGEGEMGPWWIRREELPFRPGVRYDIIADSARTGKIDKNTIIRGPTTKQLWDVAGRVKGIAHLLGKCHKCGEKVDPSARSCSSCSADFYVYRDRNNLGLDQSNPSEGEVEGTSCFISEESIFETQATPLTVPNVSTRLPEKEENPVGSPQFRAVQRLLELSKKKNKILMVSLAACVVIVVILILLLVTS